MTTTPTVPMGTSDLLAQVVSARVAANREEANLLRFVGEFADAHPVWGEVIAADWGSDDPCVREQPTGQVAGPGTPAVAEYAVVELAAALGMAFRTALGLVADVLEIRHRLPRTWALVQAGGMPAWQARAAAQLTVGLRAGTVEFVDRQLVIAAGRAPLSGGRIRALVDQALTICEPEVMEGREDAARTAKGVWFDRHADPAPGRTPRPAGWSPPST